MRKNAFLSTAILAVFLAINANFSASPVFAQAGCTTPTLKQKGQSISNTNISLSLNACYPDTYAQVIIRDANNRDVWQSGPLTPGIIHSLSANVALNALPAGSNNVKLVLQKGSTDPAINELVFTDELSSQVQFSGDLGGGGGGTNTQNNQPGTGGTTTTQSKPDKGIDLGSVFTLGADSTKSVASVYLSPSVLVNMIVKNLFVIAGLLLFITFLYVGYKFNAQGTKGKDEAKTILTTAITGFIVMFVAYWLVQILQIITGIKFFI